MPKHYYLKIGKMQFKMFKFISPDPNDSAFALLESYSIPGKIERIAFKDLLKNLPIYYTSSGKKEKENKQPSVF